MSNRIAIAAAVAIAAVAFTVILWAADYFAQATP
jgi:hypothetical protein